MIKRNTTYWPLVTGIYFFQTVYSCLWFSQVAEFGKVTILRDFPGYVVVFSLAFFSSFLFQVHFGYCQQMIRVTLILVCGVCLMCVKIFGIVAILVFVKVLVQAKVSGMMTRFVVEKLTLVLAVQIGEWLNICKKNYNFDLNNTIPDFSPLIHLLMLHIFHKFQLSLPGTIYCSPLN